MAATHPVQADDASTPDDAKAEHSQFGAGETGGGRPADGIDGNVAVPGTKLEEDTADVGVPPDEDPRMGV